MGRIADRVAERARGFLGDVYDRDGEIERLGLDAAAVVAERDELRVENARLRAVADNGYRDLVADLARFYAGPWRPGGTEWGETRTEWTWGVRHPDGTAHLALHMNHGRAEDVVRREFDPVVENMGYRKVLLCRTVEAWRPADYLADRIAELEQRDAESRQHERDRDPPRAVSEEPGG